MVILNTEDILLRPLNLNDAEILFNFIKNKEDNPFSDFKYPFSLEDCKEMINKMNSSNKEKFVSFAVSLPNNKSIGFVSLQISKKNKNAEIGYWIAKDYRNKGYGTQAINLITRYGLLDLDLELIYCGIDIDNLASIHIIEKCGYISEGILRKRHFFDGEFKNSAYYSITKEELDNLNR